MNNQTQIQRTETHLNALREAEMLNLFTMSMDVKKTSQRLYKRTLQRFLSWVKEAGYVLSEITRAEVLEYKTFLLESGMSSLTVGSYITSVRKFYEWTEANRLYPNVAKGIKTPKRKRAFKKLNLKPEQAKELLDYFTSKSKRDYAIVNLLLRCGLRTIELIRANVEDITYIGDQKVLMVHGKGRDEKDNFVILTDKAYEPIAEYLETRGRTNTAEPLFTSISNNSKGGRLSTRTVSKIAKEGLKAIGIDDRRYTAHSLRHTVATNILRAGGSLEMVQHTLRHTNPATTQAYTDIMDEERRLENSGEALLDQMY